MSDDDTDTETPETMFDTADYLDALVADMRATIDLVRADTRGDDDSPVIVRVGDLALLLDVIEAAR